MTALTPRYAIFILCAVVLLVFGTTLGNDYVWDDFEYISVLQLHQVDNLISSVFSEPFYTSANYYRPFAVLSIFWEARLSHENPFWGHLTNLLIHLINTLLIFKISFTLAKKTGSINNAHILPVSLFVSLFFAITPIMIESVSWISARFDLFATLFALLITYILFCKPHNLKNLLLASGCYLLGAMSKEMIITLPLIFLFILKFIQVYSGKQQTNFEFLNKSFYYFWPLILGGLSYLAIRYIALGYLIVDESRPYHIPYNSILEHALVVIKTLGIYLKKLFFPFIDVSPLHPFPTTHSWSDPDSVIGLLALCLILSGIIFRKLTILALYLAVYCVALLPVIHLVPLGSGNNIVHERFMVMPMAFICCISGILFYSVYQQATPILKKLMSGVLIVWFILSISVSYSLLPMWKNNDSLWSWEIALHPESYLANSNYAVILYNQGKYAEAVKYYEKSFQIHPTENDIRMIANIYFQLKDFKRSELAYQKMNQYPLSKESYGAYLIGLAYSKTCQKSYEGVESLLKEATEVTTDLNYLHQVGVIFYSRTKEYDKFMHALEILKGILPQTKIDEISQAYNNNTPIGC